MYPQGTSTPFNMGHACPTTSPARHRTFRGQRCLLSVRQASHVGLARLQCASA